MSSSSNEISLNERQRRNKLNDQDLALVKPVYFPSQYKEFEKNLSFARVLLRSTFFLETFSKQHLRDKLRSIFISGVTADNEGLLIAGNSDIPTIDAISMIVSLNNTNNTQKREEIKHRFDWTINDLFNMSNKMESCNINSTNSRKKCFSTEKEMVDFIMQHGIVLTLSFNELKPCIDRYLSNKPIAIMRNNEGRVQKKNQGGKTLDDLIAEQDKNLNYTAYTSFTSLNTIAVMFRIESILAKNKNIMLEVPDVQNGKNGVVRYFNNIEAEFCTSDELLKNDFPEEKAEDTKYEVFIRVVEVFNLATHRILCYNDKKIDNKKVRRMTLLKHGNSDVITYLTSPKANQIDTIIKTFFSSYGTPKAWIADVQIYSLTTQKEILNTPTNNTSGIEQAFRTVIEAIEIFQNGLDPDEESDEDLPDEDSDEEE